MHNPFTHYSPPDQIHRITSIDMHTGGEPLRVITSGFPPLCGNTQLARRADCHARYDQLRQALMFEPRGHADMYGALITPPERPNSLFGVLFLHNEGYSTMCGHAILALARLAKEAGQVPAEEPFFIDTPAGQVQASCNEDGSASFTNVASFVEQGDVTVEHPTLGTVPLSLVYGGAYYAFVDADNINLPLKPENSRAIIKYGREIKALAQAAFTLEHPLDPALSFLYGTIFTARTHSPGVHSRHACVFADGELDRSPTGTGVCARLALLRHRGELAPGETLVIESILKSPFAGTIQQCLTLKGRPAIVPEISGKAFVTGRHEFLIDPEDPLAHGFIFR